MKTIILPIILLLLLPAFTIHAEPIQRVTASAGVISNMRNSENSIKFKSNQLLTDAFTKTNELIIFTSVPTTFLEGEKDDNNVSCDTRFTETQSSPLVYIKNDFKNKDDLINWISNFSQGDGKEGNDLYKKCSGDCSPQYSYKITRNTAGNFSLTASVICGKARNKSDDLYELTITY